MHGNLVNAMPLLQDTSRSSPGSGSSPFPVLSRAIKRQRDAGDGESTRESKGSSKRRRSNRVMKQENDEELDLEQGINTAIGKLDSRLLADFVAQRAMRFAPYLSMVELEDQYIPGGLVIDFRDS